MTARGAISLGLVALGLAGCGSGGAPALKSTSSAPSGVDRKNVKQPSKPARERRRRHRPRPAPAPVATTPATTTPIPTATTPPPTQAPHLPVTLRFDARHALTPPLVDVPTRVTIDLSLISGDGRAHVVTVRTPSSHRLSVPANGRVTLRLAGLPQGHFRLVPAGSDGGVPPGATLVVGNGAVGP